MLGCFCGLSFAYEYQLRSCALQRLSGCGTIVAATHQLGGSGAAKLAVEIMKIQINGKGSHHLGRSGAAKLSRIECTHGVEIMTIRIIEYAHAFEIMTTRIDGKGRHQQRWSGTAIMMSRIHGKGNHQLDLSGAAKLSRFQAVKIMTIQINGKGSRQLGQRGAADGKNYRRSTQTTRIDGKSSHQLGRR